MVWQAGQLLHNGKYEILEVLGRGGFGLTYKARHRQLTLEVVIKTPDISQKRDTEYEYYVRQFEAEALKLAIFSRTPHAHIVRISDFFTEGQVPCLVMDFIQGQTLMERVKTQGKLSEAECLKYIRQIGSALEAVHQAGMVHRDAHPGNIMIQPNGNAILIDFGIAKEIIPAGSSSTDYAANPDFAPYEQVYKGSKANRQPSVDIYALAASFYYAVTGQKPTPSMERRLDNRPLTLPKEINPNLSDHLNTAITLGMALEKENRPQSMSDWLQQLELPPPPVEEKYRQEIVNPPQPRNEPKGKDFPWGLLIGVFLMYGVIGYSVWIFSTPWLLVLGTVFSAIAFAVNFAWAVLFCFVLTIVMSWALLVLVVSIMSKGSFSFIWIRVFAMIVVIPVFLIMFIISLGVAFTVYEDNYPYTNKLEKYFGGFYSFLIISGTNLSGLASGWLLAFLLHPKG
ncbi:MAG: serine/threonine protein kinase [Microcystis aeruginosa Ma_MB_S_20031200_S102]|uniref:Serine/threonine protein kinase n=1 Tax=Microcystis aeruginosa Ma_MB_S_20031200_S102 TaxID=2486254 RepID=A0A552F3H3_MICAE|nr:MAG: serine/threonine protein kinase [Microcystis aeruginosa Ma_MB_S_20031200_S102D]TRU41247.1 MAG: serine/threonine protein kinase [Microcystis aeruginosa Ma_MB_S_20031200_S102]